jgi:hypothetical protein
MVEGSAARSSVDTPSSSAKGTVAATNISQTSAQNREPTESSMNERRTSASTPIPIYSTNIALAVGVPDAILQTQRKQDDNNVQSNPQ